MPTSEMTPAQALAYLAVGLLVIAGTIAVAIVIAALLVRLVVVSFGFALG